MSNTIDNSNIIMNSYDSNASTRSSTQCSSMDTPLASNRRSSGKSSSSFKKNSKKLMAATPIVYLFKGSSGSRSRNGAKNSGGSRSSRVSQRYLQEAETPPPEGTDSIESMNSFLSAITLPDSLRGASLLPVPENDAKSKFSSSDRDCRPRPPLRTQSGDV